MSPGDGEVEGKSKELTCEPVGKTFTSDAPHSASPDETDSFKQTATEDASVSDQIPDVVASKTEQESQQLTSPPPENNNISTESSSQSNGHGTLSGNNTDTLISDLQTITDAEGQEKPSEDTSVTPKEAFTVMLEKQENLNTAADVPTCSEEDKVASSTRVTEKKSGRQTTSTNPESDKTDIKSLNSASQPETVKPLTEKPCEDVNVSPKKVFTIVLDTELPLSLSQDVEQSVEDSLKSNVSQVSQASPSQKPLVLKTVQSTGAKSSSRDEAEADELMNPSAAATTRLDAKQEETTGSCHTEEQTTSSVLCPAESSTETGGALTTTGIPAGDNSKQVSGADAAESTGTGHAGTTEGEGPESKCSDASLQEEESESKTPAALEDTEQTQEQVGLTFYLFSCFLFLCILPL